MEHLVETFINLFNNINNKEIIVFIISLFPILELRGGMLAASILKVPFFNAVISSVVGNVLPIPFVLLLIEKILNIMELCPLTKKLALWLRNKANKNKKSIEKYGYLGLILFVGIPLPGTGAWTGALVASLLHLDKKKSFICIIIGVLLALIIMSIISYGILSNLIH